MGQIRAIVTMDAARVSGGGAPVFIASGPEERNKIAFLLEKIMDASAHDLQNGLLIIVDHKD